jgi:hypothetical protein
MRRVDARSSDSRIKVNNKIKLGKTENSTGRRIWIAVSNTSTEAVILNVSNRSSTKLGNGTSMTNTRATAPVGITHSEYVRSVLSNPDFLFTATSLYF